MTREKSTIFFAILVTLFLSLLTVQARNIAGENCEKECIHENCPIPSNCLAGLIKVSLKVSVTGSILIRFNRIIAIVVQFAQGVKVKDALTKVYAVKSF